MDDQWGGGSAEREEGMRNKCSSIKNSKWKSCGSENQDRQPRDL